MNPTVCPNCGGPPIGDGVSVVLHCENAYCEKYLFAEPDAAPVWCEPEAVAAFHAHLEVCPQCGPCPFGLCKEGARLLMLVAEQIP